jgi:hypothetical protein
MAFASNCLPLPKSELQILSYIPSNPQDLSGFLSTPDDRGKLNVHWYSTELFSLTGQSLPNHTQPSNMFALWDADGNEIRDEYPQVDPYDILRNPENGIFNLDMIVDRLKEIGGSDIVSLHQLAQNHYFVINVPQSPTNSHHDENYDLGY